MARKKRRVRKTIRNFLVVALFVFLSAILGVFVQRYHSSTTREVKVEYKTINTKKESKASMVMVGDALIHGTVYETAHKNGNYNSYDFKPMLARIKKIVEPYDLAYYNQETIL